MNTTAALIEPREPEIIGPYSEWPRRTKKIWKTPATFAGTVIVAGVYLHCGIPLLV